MEYNEEPLFKYQEVYFYDRRFSEKKASKNILDKNADGKKFIELVVAKENNDDNIIKENN